MQQFFDFPVSQRFSFDSFISCHGNETALRLARRIADPAEPENLIYLHGSSGSGRTHLLRSIAGADIPYLSLKDSRDPDVFVSTFSGAAGLVVDDLHLMPEDSALRGVLWQLFNEFQSSGRVVAMAGLHPPRELAYLDEHLISRLLWGLVARLDTSDDNSRCMILKKIAKDRQLRVSDDVIRYILATTSREAGDLISAFNRLYAFSMSSKRRITLQLAREVHEMMQTGGAAL